MQALKRALAAAIQVEELADSGPADELWKAERRLTRAHRQALAQGCQVGETYSANYQNAPYTVVLGVGYVRYCPIWN